MYKLHTVVVILFLVVRTTCDVQSNEGSKNVTMVHNSTDPIESKVIEKRQVDASAEPHSEPQGQNVIGLGSVGIQVLTGLLENMLNTDGMNSQAVGSLLNLFNPEKIRNDLLLIRRVFNLFARFGTVLNRYLPAPAATGSSFKPLDLLSSKVRLYTPEHSEDVQWVPIVKNGNSNNPLLSIPTRVQSMVDYVTQKPASLSSTDNESESNQNSNDESQNVTEMSKDSDIVNGKMNDVEVKSISTNSIEYDTDKNDRSNNMTGTEKTVVEQRIQLEYGLSNYDDKPAKVSGTDSPAIISTHVKPTSDKPENPKVDINPSYTSLSLEYGSPTDNPPKIVTTEGTATVYDLLLQRSKDNRKKNENSGKPRIPSSSGGRGSNVMSDRISYGLDSVESKPADDNGMSGMKGLSFRPVQQVYGVPDDSMSSNKLGRKRDKTGLRPRHGHLPNIRKESRSNDDYVETNNYPSIAQVPLERHRIFDRVHGPLRDSFGHPIRN